jgi:hypothetical protein
VLWLHVGEKNGYAFAKELGILMKTKYLTVYEAHRNWCTLFKGMEKRSFPLLPYGFFSECFKVCNICSLCNIEAGYISAFFRKHKEVFWLGEVEEARRRKSRMSLRNE